METINNDQMIQRPWQGTALGILEIIGLVIVAIVMLVMIFGAGLIGSVLQKFADDGGSAVSTISTTVFVVLGIVVFLPITVLSAFVTWGVFVGKKWAIIIALVLTGLYLLGSLFSFNILGLAIGGFMLYCELICLKNSYYK